LSGEGKELRREREGNRESEEGEAATGAREGRKVEIGGGSQPPETGK
jgi:hypothetical protein